MTTVKAIQSQVLALNGLSTKSSTATTDDFASPKVQVERQKLLESLRDHQIDIPDLRPLFQAWPQAVNPQIDTLRRDVEQLLIE